MTKEIKGTQNKIKTKKKIPAAIFFPKPTGILEKEKEKRNSMEA